MASADHYDAIVIGSGQAGTPLCTALAEAGFRTALVEREHVGGTCVNEGCTPTKTMVASARVTISHGEAPIMASRRGASASTWNAYASASATSSNIFRDGQQARIERTPNLDLLLGEASFTAPKSVRPFAQKTAARTFTHRRHRSSSTQALVRLSPSSTV